MAVLTRIKNNQVTDASAGNVYLGVNAAAKVQDFSITAGKIANNLTYGSDLTVTGNLTVQGNTTTIDTVNLVVEDPLILLAKEQTGSPSLDIGFIGKRGTSDNIAFVWDESADQFVAVFTTSETTNTTISINSYASLQVLDLTAATANIAGNVVVGNISVTGNITGSANFSGNVAASNFLTTGLVSATGNVTGGNVNTAGAVSATGNVNSGNVNTGIVSASGNVNGSGAVFSGNVTAQNFIGNISGNIDAGGANTNVQFNDDDLLNGSANFTFDKATNIMSVTGTIQGTTVSATGNVIGGNVSTAGLVTATGNVIGGNLNTAGVVSATGNVDSGNVNTGIVSASGNVNSGNVNTAIVSASGNVTGANLITGGLITATGNINSGANIVATANVIGGNLSTAGLVTATGNVTGGNLTTAGVVTATGNVNSGNVNTGIVSASGNVNSGNVNTAIVSASGNVTGANLITGGLITATGNIIGPNIVTTTVTTSSGDLILNSASGVLQWDGSGNIIMNSQWINGLSDPVQAFDAATKQYVDDAVSSGIHIHTPVDVETEAPLTTVTYANGGNTFTVTDTVAGNTVVFSTVANLQVNDQLWFTNSFNGVVGNLAYFVVSTPNTSAAVLSTVYNGVPVSNITTGSSLTQPVRVDSGVGATLTATANGAIVVDGVSLVTGNRVLVRDQLNQIQNGVYVVTDTGNVTAPYILTRSSDTNTYEPDTSTGLDQGSYFYVKYGDVGAGSSYVKTAPSGPFIFGVANLEFTLFSASQVYSANTAAGISLTGTVFSAKVDNNTTAFDGGGNISVKAGANLTTPNIGAATGTSLNVTGNVDGGNLNTGGVVSATGNVTGGNLITGGLVQATGNVNSGNVNTTLVSATGNVIGGNVSTAGLITATGNVTGGNLLTGGVISATGNIDSGANIVATANVVGGNLSTAGVVTATGNVTGGNLITGGLVQATGNVNSGNVNTTIVSATGNVIAGNVSTAGLVTATGNVTGGNILTGGLISATGNVNSGNVNTGIISATGNVNGTGAVFSGNVTAQNFIGNISGNIDAAGSNTQVQFNDTGDLLGASANFTFDKATNIMSVTGTVQGTTVSATGNVIGGNVSTAGNITGANLIFTSGTIDGPAAGRITINASDLDTDFAIDGDSTPNVFYVDAGLGTTSFGNSGAIANAIVSFNTTDSIKMPVGNTAQRPDPATVGMLRFSTSGDSLEVYTSNGWESVGVPAFTIVTDDQFSGTGACTVFTLSEDSTTAATIVSINGVVQIPTTAYSVSGNVLTFTEAPEVSDVIDARLLTTTTTVTRIENVSGNAVIEVTDTANDVLITGDILPTANAVANIGSSSFQFNTIFARATSAQYADLAEMYVADQIIEPGTVVCFGGDYEVTICDTDNCSRVAGVVSTNPSYIMNAGLAGDNVVAVALTGRVPTRVTGQVRKGDMMVSTADGRARACATPAVGQVIGKALADFDGTDGVIEVVVGRL